MYSRIMFDLVTRCSIGTSYLHTKLTCPPQTAVRLKLHQLHHQPNNQHIFMLKPDRLANPLMQVNTCT